MPALRNFVLLAVMLISNVNLYSQCKHTLLINSYDVTCNGNGFSIVDINVTVLFGSGNNSATISYNLGSGEVVAEILEDDNGDIISKDCSFLVPSCDNYTVTLTAWTNPSGSGTSCTDPAPVIAPIILPVDFGDLNLKLHNSNLRLIWNTFSEINNDRFEIERSFEGRGFEKIGEVKGATDSNTEKVYSFDDHLVDQGVYYYRIRQVDLDGKFSFSDMKSIYFNKESRFNVYPNPANAFINISNAETGKFLILNMSGQTVKEIIVNNDNYKIDISDLESGLYFISNIERTQAQRFIKK